MAESESPDTKQKQKDPHWKGQSRVLKMCHWCTKKQEPGVKSFQACGQCKEVIYCSKECQVAAWPFHKTGCKLSAQNKAAAAAHPDGPQVGKDIATFKKWHSLNLESLKHAAICALDLGKDPKNLDKGVIFVEAKLKANHDQLLPKHKYELVGGFKMTMDEAREIVGRFGGDAILDSCRQETAFMRKKGGIGIVPVFMSAHGIIDVVKILLPRPAVAAVAQRANDWGDLWFEHLRAAVEED